MDLLGSIMSAMDKPPVKSESERLMEKKRKEEYEKRQKAQSDLLKRFKEDVEAKLISHFEDGKNYYLKFKPMDHMYRCVIHEVAESLQLKSYGFGTDGVDRYVRVYKIPPCEDELAARRAGEPWNEEIRQALMEKRKHEKDEEDIECLQSKKSKKTVRVVPATNYKDKYAHLIGQEVSIQAPVVTDSKMYGFVPSENKKDVRSIEQTMADIKAKKMKKLEDAAKSSTNITNE